MSLDRLINMVVILALIEMMVLIGLRAIFTELVQTIRNRRVVAQAGIANYLLVPGATVALFAISMSSRPSLPVFFCWRSSPQHHLGHHLRGSRKQMSPRRWA